MTLFVQHDVIYCDWEESGKLVPYKGKVVTVKNKKIKVEFGDGEKWWFSLKQQAGLRRTRGQKRTSELAFGASERKIKRQSVSGRSMSTYNAKLKADSKNKIMCREILVAGLPGTNASKRALVLDAEDMKFTRKLVEEKGFRSEKVDVPNCNEPEVTAQMEELGIGNVHGGTFMGDFMRSVEKKKYDLVYADYCGQPGSTDKINTPLHDLNELFALNLVASSATIGVTVCIRNNVTTKVLYQNMHRVTNAVVSAAFTHGFVATIKCQTTYKDPGSQTMCFSCVSVEKI
tara:strand:+ start:126 stop:989 length:864 start_codon:yes stop_codon:yes gene_type:complete